MSDWINTNTRQPNKREIYNVKCDGETYKGCLDFGYWNGEEWERVHEASEHQSIMPTYADYDSVVTHWLPNEALAKQGD